MGGVEPPFLYDPPSQYTFGRPTDRGFNPRAATQASWSPPRPKPRPNGPMVDFNRHPDSYPIIPYGNIDAKPMSPNTKKKVKYTRWIQLFLRICALLGALGVLFCVICVRDTSTQLAWIIRVAPAVAILHVLYAVYHLCRSAEGRPPASSASYMMFAAVMDSGLIPFYVFTAACAQMQRADEYTWTTLFQTQEILELIVYAMFLTTLVCSGIHLVSLALSIYLAVIYRKIAKLPPDMNPLEDNLTARPHKRNKSEIAEKHMSQSSVDSAETKRLAEIEEPAFPTRSVPFMHTRTDSAGNDSNRPYSHASNAKSSYVSAQTHRYSRSDLPSQQQRFYDQNSSSGSLSRSSAQKSRGLPSRPTSVIGDAPVLEPSHGSTPFKRDNSRASALLDDNWFTYPSTSPSPQPQQPAVTDRANDEAAAVPSRSGTIDSVSHYTDAKDWETETTATVRPDARDNEHGHYTPLNYQEFYGNDEDEHRYGLETNYENDENVYVFEKDIADGDPDILMAEDAPRTKSPRDPLGMNPPTPQPPPSDAANSNPGSRSGSLRRIALSDVPNPAADGNNMWSSTGTKQRFYGEIVGRSPTSIRRDISKLPEQDSKKTSPGKNLFRRKSGKYEPIQVDDEENVPASDLNQLNVKRGSRAEGESDRKGRVVSNSGVDLGNGLHPGAGLGGYGNYIAGLGVGRRRDVSGKIAEEGRSGAENSPNNLGTNVIKPGEIRAAGWARWKGL